MNAPMRAMIAPTKNSPTPIPAAAPVDTVPSIDPVGPEIDVADVVDVPELVAVDEVAGECVELCVTVFDGGDVEAVELAVEAVAEAVGKLDVDAEVTVESAIVVVTLFVVSAAVCPLLFTEVLILCLR